MPVDIAPTLRQALARLTREQEHLQRQITAIETALSAVDRRGRRGRPAGRKSSKGDMRKAMTPRTKGRPGMSAAARKAASRRMKAYWAKRRSKAKAKKP